MNKEGLKLPKLIEEKGADLMNIETDDAKEKNR